MSILAFTARRLLAAIPLILLIMLAVFGLMHAAKGSPFRPPEGYVSLPYTLQRDLEAYYNLDEPWYVEFATYVGNVARLEFGPSLTNRHQSVDDVIRNNLPITGGLVLLASGWATVAGFALGVIAAVRRGSRVDYLVTSTATVFLVVPVFFVSFALSAYLVSRWHLFPPGWADWEARVLPTFSLGLGPAGYIARLVRGAVVETLAADYVRTARAKGLRFPQIVAVHVLRNSLGPFLSAAVPMFALLITGAFFVELYFRIPGASIEFLEAARLRDYPMIMGLTVVLAAIIVALNLLADVVAATLDPRLREGA